MGGIKLNFDKVDGKTGVGSFLYNNKIGLSNLAGSVLGGSGGGSKAGGVVGSLVGGPVGGAIGNVAGGVLDKTLGSYFASFKQGGLKCLGKQAMTQADANRILNDVNNRLNQVNNLDASSVADGLSYLSENIAYNRRVASVVSGCSRINANYVADQMQKVLDEYLKNTGFKFKTETRHRPDGNKAPIPYTGYISDGYNIGYGGDMVKTELYADTGGLTTSDIKNAFSLEGLDASLYTPGFVEKEYTIDEVDLGLVSRNSGGGTWNGGFSGRTGDGISWNIGAGKDNRDDELLRTIMLVGLGLVGYKLFVK